MGDMYKQYRTDLMNLEQKAQDDFDKTILTLSGGALGLTIAFIKDIIGDDPVVSSKLIFWAWILWGISITAILISFYSSTFALRKAIKRFDDGNIQKIEAGDWRDSVTGILNAIGGITFVVGVVLAAIFTYLNL